MSKIRYYKYWIVSLCMLSSTTTNMYIAADIENFVAMGFVCITIYLMLTTYEEYDKIKAKTNGGG